MATRAGKNTLMMQNKPCISGFAAVAGKKEGEGPLARRFDKLYEDTHLGQTTWEKAESTMQGEVVNLALGKANLTAGDLQLILAGDLLNQCISSTYGLRELNVPMLGLFGACSTMALSLGTGAVLVESGAVQNCAAVTSSHFCTAERQFRYPLDYGGQRAPTSQWTATAAGSTVLTPGGNTGVPSVQAVTFGKIVDMGITDMNNMGSAMAGAAADTITNFFTDTGKTPDDFDMVLTGDLSQVGSDLMNQILVRSQIELKEKHADCGLLIYDRETQAVAAGGSGCGCSAAVLCSYVLQEMQAGNLKNVLFVGTGALMSPTSVQQGESIPGIAHAVWITGC